MKYFNSILKTLILIFVQVTWAEKTLTWRAGSPENLPQLHGLNVECGQDDMTVYLKFDLPFDGSIYSKGSGRCVHVAPHSHITEATFTIEYNECNTRSDPKGKYYENTIVIQYDDAVIEAWDIAKKIRCEWHDGYEKSAFKQPITISDLDVVEMNFQGDDVDCWLEIQDGKGPWSSKVEGLVPLGSPLTLVVAIQDAEGQFDMRVKACKAHDGQRHPVYLTDDEGCVLRPKMMSPFIKTRNTKGTASIVSYSHFYAFKFPETVDVNVQCTVEICRNGCPDSCNHETNPTSEEKSIIHDYSSDDKPATEDIPTYRDSYPHSSVITSKPAKKKNNTASITSEVLKRNNTSNKDLDISNSHVTHNFLPPYPPNLFDVLHEGSDENLDEYGQYEDKKSLDSEYAESEHRKDFTNIPEFLKEHFSIGKKFPNNQQKSKKPQQEKQPSENLKIIIPQPLIQSTEETIMRTSDNDSTKSTTTSTHPIPSTLLTSDAETFEILTTPSTLETSKTEFEIHTDGINNDVLHDFDHRRLGDSFHENSSIPEQHDNVEIFTEDTNAEMRFYESKPSIPSDETTSDESKPSVHVDEEHLHEIESSVHSEETHLDEIESSLHSNEFTPHSAEYDTKDQHYDEYDRNPIEGRMPMKTHKSITTAKKLSYHNYKPFKPPYPLPPLTLYNGIPLHYYHQHKADMELKSYHQRKHLDTMVFHGVQRGRRYRRQIGEKEQLGLQQTFRVIAPTDLDFIMSDESKFKPGRKEAKIGNVCMASTSLAAGLGLLLLANICGAAVATFLAYHYITHRKTKVKAMELLSKDVSS